tara:strand:+ start:2484 stop:2729 length:246 start_codon:yes stop_codon:yes gene_type:complete
MDISKMNRMVRPSTGDGNEYAIIIRDVVNIIKGQDIYDAIDTAVKLGICKKGYCHVPLDSEKAVLIPGVWEYPMAVYNGIF